MLFFLQIFQSHPGGLNDELGEVAVCSLNGFLHLLQNLIGKADGFGSGAGNGGQFKFSHSITMSYILWAVIYSNATRMRTKMQMHCRGGLYGRPSVFVGMRVAQSERIAFFPRI